MDVEINHNRRVPWLFCAFFRHHGLVDFNKGAYGEVADAFRRANELSPKWTIVVRVYISGPSRKLRVAAAS